MKVHQGSYLKLKGIIIRIWITAIFVFLCFIAIKIAVPVQISCNCKGKFKALGNYSVFSISADVSFNDVLSDLEF